jgi:predicted nucleic-acid-binding protein
VIAVDTNILLRYWVNDDSAQHAGAARLLNTQCSPASPAFVSLVVLAEFVWVLQRTYRVNRDGLADAVMCLIDNAHLKVESEQLVESAVQSFLDGRADFADYLIVAVGRSHGATPTHTFDQIAGAEAGFVLEPA